MSAARTTIRGVVRGGVVVFDLPTKLPEGTEVEVIVAPLPFTPEEQVEWETWKGLRDDAWAMIDPWEKEEDDRAIG